MTRSTSPGPSLLTRRRAGGKVTAHAVFGGTFVSFGDASDPSTPTRFAAALLAWESAGRKVTPAVFDAAAGRPLSAGHGEPGGLTVRDLVAQYETWLDTTGRHREPDGRPSTLRMAIEKGLAEFVESAGDLGIERVSCALLHRHRDRLEGHRHLTRYGINRKLSFVVAALRWAWKRGILPTPAWADAKLLEPLTRAEAGNRPQGIPKRLPTLDEIRAVLPHCSRQVAGLVRLQALTGMRPGEAVTIRFEDVERVTRDGVSFGIYRVVRAKTQRYGYETSYVLNARALELLDEFKRPGGGYVFRPCDAERERSIERREARETKPTKQTRDRDERARRRAFAERYDRADYAQALERACKAAGIAKFVPHSLRHLVATWAANNPLLGAGAARAALGHANPASTARYLHRDDSLRYGVAALAAKELAI
ncbi:MAG: tyrosine-type recombinase/integrase [Planctomycetes bacterium]|nr:tyrosine-type recombinase/integrase [Planctomycetota bacterium]